MFSHTAFSGLIGVARTDITPPVGIYCRNWGAARHDAAEGVHRPLWMTALAVGTRDDARPLVLIDADLGWWGSVTQERAFRSRVRAALGLELERFFFCLTHTHGAPPLAEPEPHWQGGDLLAAYLQQVERATVSTARAAIAAMEPAQLEWTRGRCQVACNRDLPDPENIRRAQPRIVCGFHPAETADDTLVAARATAADGRTLATISNYACHPTTLAWDNKLISPDYVGALRETVERTLDGGLALFLQGAGGELAPRMQYVGDPAVADAHGRAIGYATLAALETMEPPGQALAYAGTVESGAPLAVWRREPRPASPQRESVAARRTTVDVPLKNWPTAAELATQWAACEDRALAERLRRQLRIREALGDGATFPLEIWGWRIGEALLLGTMCEGYSRIQQRVRAAFPERQVAWLNELNGWIGYLPPAEIYDDDIYQVWQTPCDRGSLELVEEGAIALGRQLLEA